MFRQKNLFSRPKLDRGAVRTEKKAKFPAKPNKTLLKCSKPQG